VCVSLWLMLAPSDTLQHMCARLLQPVFSAGAGVNTWRTGLHQGVIIAAHAPPPETIVRTVVCEPARPPAIYYLKQPHQMPFESSNYPRSSQDTAASCFPGAHPFFRKLLLRAPGMLNSPCFIFSCARRFYFFRPSSEKMLDSDEINFC
jgi:hypothetical protein